MTHNRRDSLCVKFDGGYFPGFLNERCEECIPARVYEDFSSQAGLAGFVSLREVVR